MPRSLSKKNENAEPENTGSRKRGARKRRAPENCGIPENAEPESADPRKRGEILRNIDVSSLINDFAPLKSRRHNPYKASTGSTN